MESWDGGKVMMGCIFFVITLESISTIPWLSMDWVKIMRNAKISCKDSIKRFRKPGKKIPKLYHGFNKEVMEGV